jgi:CheY-like chemotaxis protein
MANGAHALVVLLAEDEFLVRYNVADCLQSAGYVVVEAGSGEEAIALCNPETSIDIVITDINLGGFASGWDVAECFRRFRPHVPVVYASGRSLDQNVVFLGASSSRNHTKTEKSSKCVSDSQMNFNGLRNVADRLCIAAFSVTYPASSISS